MKGKFLINKFVKSLAVSIKAFYTPPAFSNLMAKGKSVSYVWICQETKQINGSGWAQRDKLKDMERMKYSPKLRKMTKHVAKPVKKGGTKALANAK